MTLVPVEVERSLSSVANKPDVSPFIGQEGGASLVVRAHHPQSLRVKEEITFERAEQ